MSPTVAHPRALAAFRLLVYGLCVVLASAIVAVTVGFLFVLGLFTALLGVLAGESVAVPLLLLLGGGLLGGTCLVGVVVVTARRLDRVVTRADRVPTPVEIVHRQYVDGELDERGLERGLEHALGGTLADEPGRWPPTGAGRDEAVGSRVELERPVRGTLRRR